jgi:hypothetical protein
MFPEELLVLTFALVVSPLMLKDMTQLNIKYCIRINLRLYCSLESTVFDADEEEGAEESPVPLDATSDVDACSIDGERTPRVAKILF